MTPMQRARRWIGFKLFKLSWWVMDPSRVVSVKSYAPGESPEEKGLKIADSALDVGRRILSVHANVQMDTPKDKDLHARACEVFEAALNVIESRISEERGVASGRPCTEAH